jgi:hypothetical protein
MLDVRNPGMIAARSDIPHTRLAQTGWPWFHAFHRSVQYAHKGHTDLVRGLEGPVNS